MKNNKLFQWFADHSRASVIIVCFLIIGIRAVFPDILFDTISLWLFLITVVVWLLPDFPEFLSRIKRFKKGDIEIEFESRVSELAKKTEEIEEEVEKETEIIASNEIQYEGLSAETKSILSKSAAHPRTALITLAVEIETELRNISEQNDISGYQKILNPSRLVQELVNRKILTTNVQALFKDFWTIRNQAVHGSNFEVSQDKLYELVELGIRLLKILKYQGGSSSSSSSSSAKG
jgi:hypothetical protein